MSLAAENERLRAALEDIKAVADECLMGITFQRIDSIIRAALASIPEPSLHEVEIGAADRIAVIFKPDDVRRLLTFIDCSSPDRPEDKQHDLMPEEWDRIDEALADGIRAYDGPDGEDDRVFTDASGKPHYEP
jgi:hypothetical protein